MTRFQQEYSGELGEFWKKEAEKELQEIRKELETGKITIDSNGVARNCIGRVLMSDMREKLSYVTDKFSVEATAKACDEENKKVIAEYRKNYKGPSEEEMFEMRAAFGAGATIVDIFTGDEIHL